jgi:hypothetical protein
MRQAAVFRVVRHSRRFVPESTATAGASDVGELPFRKIRLRIVGIDRWKSFRVFLSLATQFWAFDNSNSDINVRGELIAEGRRGVLTSFDPSQTFLELCDDLSKLARAS